MAAFTVPTLVTGPVIGAYLDRLKAKRALFAANQVTLAAALTGVAVLAGHAPGTVLIGLGLLAGLPRPCSRAGSAAWCRWWCPRSVRRANALDAASYNVAGVPALALVAALAGAAGAGLALSAVAGIAALGLVLVLCIPMPATTPRFSRGVPGHGRVRPASGSLRAP